MNITREQYIRTTSTRMAAAMLEPDLIDATSSRFAEIAEAAFFVSEHMADCAERMGYASWIPSDTSG